MLRAMRAMLALLFVARAVVAASPAELEAPIERGLTAGGERSAIGVTRQGVAIPSLLGEDSLDHLSPKVQALVVGGLDGSERSVELALQAWEWFHGPEASAMREQYALAVVPAAHPHAWLSGSGPELLFPPDGEHYSSEANVEAQYLWRWIGMHAPDIVVFPGAGGSLASALMSGAPAGVGSIRAVGRVGAKSGRDVLEPVLQPMPLSAARREIQLRLKRTPVEVARQLAEVYGHELPSVVYIPAVAIVGRLRLGELTGDESVLRDVERIVKPYLEGEPTLGEKPSGSHLPGHLVFGELARLTGNAEYAKLARRAADMGFAAGGAMLESMPLHNEMSDSVFMGCAILAQVGRLTGDGRYLRMALRHLRFIEALDLRPDGLYRHSPLDEAAWGRGNGFPALGLAWVLSEMPDGAPERAGFLEAYRALMAALIEHQDATGMWHQVVDMEESYRELTSTSMIGYALSRGLRNGWIEGAGYEHALERAWYGVKTRVASDGSLVDVCTGTGKQPNLQSYLDRKAILGRDDRGGAMALLFAVEMAARAR